MNVTLRRAKPDECDFFYELMHTDMTWKKTDAPYFPYKKPTLEEFRNEYFQRLCEKPNNKVIEVDGNIVGSVGFYWEYEQSRWLEVGLTIYDPKNWGKGIAKQALIQWITDVFATQDVARVGLTTWSGNAGMMRVAEKLGMTLEARIRKVRYYEGVYYDSIKFGVLREEWEELNKQL